MNNEISLRNYSCCQVFVSNNGISNNLYLIKAHCLDPSHINTLYLEVVARVGTLISQVYRKSPKS